jgi:AraC-like DNA-binding protein
VRIGLGSDGSASNVSNVSELQSPDTATPLKMFPHRIPAAVTSTGLAPHQFVLQERINRAKALLRQGNETIVDIALGVGFENQAHFTTVFGNLVGMTPRQFQNSSDELIGMCRPFLETAQCS